MKSYRPLFGNLKLYWEQYGGFGALVTSPYFHAALLLAVINFLSGAFGAWWELAFSLLPSLIGLTLAGYAVMLSVVSGELLVLLADDDQEDALSDFQLFNNTFFHFVFVQVLALLFAFLGATVNGSSLLAWISDYADERIPEWLWVANDLARHSFNFCGSLVLTYSATLILATLIGVFRIAGLMQIFGKSQAEEREEK
jgi:uncharacterized membrane protein